VVVILVIATFILGGVIGYAIGIHEALDIFKQCKATLQQAREENLRARTLIKEMNDVCKILEAHS